MTENANAKPETAAGSTVVAWVDDYGTQCGITEISGVRRLIFKDSAGSWREVCYANSQHDEYYAFLIREGRDHGTCRIALRNQQNSVVMPRCADCGGVIGKDRGPSDGWQLEDGRTVCHACCVEDTKNILNGHL